MKGRGNLGSTALVPDPLGWMAPNSVLLKVGIGQGAAPQFDPLRHRPAVLALLLRSGLRC